MRRILNSAFRIPHLLLLLLGVACNPFAPALEEGDPLADLFGDPATVDGFFTAFKAAYELRDIALYEPLLDSSFVFVYRDFDAQVDRQWGFAQDLESTRRLFQGADAIRLEWSQVLAQNVAAPPLEATVVRSFDLTLALQTGETFRGDGNVNFTLTRRDTTAAWRLARWRDESSF